jgi:hypothetical protein
MLDHHVELSRGDLFQNSFWSDNIEFASVLGEKGRVRDNFHQHRLLQKFFSPFFI